MAGAEQLDAGKLFSRREVKRNVAFHSNGPALEVPVQQLDMQRVGLLVVADLHLGSSPSKVRTHKPCYNKPVHPFALVFEIQAIQPKAALRPFLFLLRIAARFARRWAGEDAYPTIPRNLHRHTHTSAVPIRISAALRPTQIPGAPQPNVKQDT